MRKTWKVWIILASVLALAFAVARLSPDPEPTYQGRSLSEWYAVWAATVSSDDAQSKSRAEEARAAIREIGTNALPVLLRRLERTDAPKPLVYLVNKLPGAIADSKIVNRLLLDGGKVEPMSTFEILGPLAAPAVPQLTAFMFATNKPGLANNAAQCLAAIGPDGLPPLMAALANPHPPCCYNAAYWLGIGGPFIFGTNIARAVPLLARCTAATDPRVAEASAKALGRIRMEPEIAIPALTSCLKSTNWLVRAQAVRSLATFGSQTVPILLTALNDPDEFVHRGITNCLHFLCPQVLTNSPPQ